MPFPSKASYHVLQDPALEYNNFESATNSVPKYISGSGDVLVSARGLVTNRPGFNVLLESTGTVFAGTIRRIFQWKRWDSSSGGVVGAYIWMCCETDASANTSKVYGYRVGIDTSFQLLWTCSSSDECFDFVEFNNVCGFGNGVAGNMKYYDGTTVYNWGITAPAAAPSVDASSTVGTLTSYTMNGFDYAYTYYNSNIGHESSPSALATCTGQFTLKAVQVGVVASSDAQVTHIILYRTTDGGSTDPSDMEMVGVLPTTYTNTTQTISDQATDTAIAANARNAPPFYRNDPPPASMGFVMSPSGRIFMFSGNTVYFTGREEIANGVREMCVPGQLDGNNETYQREVTGLASVGNGVAVFQADRIDKIDGDTLDSFLFYNVAKKQGARQRDAIREFMGICFWLDTGNTVWQLGADEIGKPITPDIATINHSQASMAIHLDGPDRWLLLLDGAAGKVYPLNFDTRQWMPPWNVSGAKSLYSGEVAAGDWRLAAGSVANKVYTADIAQAADGGTTIPAPTLAFNLFPVAPEAKPNLAGVADHFATKATVTPTVTYVSDDDPTQATPLACDTAVDADNCTQGTYILSKYHKANLRVAQTVAPILTWAAGATFTMYEFSIQYHPTRD